MPTLFLIVFVDLVGFGLVIPLLPFYAARFTASPLAMTALFATFSLMSFLTAPLWGRLSDRVGRRPVLMASMAASTLAYGCMAFATHLWILFAARAFAGACAGNIAAAQAYIADVTPPEKRARGMGMIGAAFGLGFIVGPVLGGLLAGCDIKTADLETPGLIAAALLLSLTALMGVSGAIIGAADGYLAYMAGRALIGVVVGGFWSMSAATAMQLVPAAQVPRALAMFNGGNALATVVAAPVGSYLGAMIGWRPDLHLSLWNPFQVADIAAPAVVTWGYADGALAALRVWFEGGGEANGVAPVALAPHA